MTKSINKQFKFVYLRNDRYDRDFDGADFSNIRATTPKFVFANKQPSHLYHNGVRANDFMSLYLRDYTKHDQKSFTEAEWTKAILTYCTQELAKLRKDLRKAKRGMVEANYYIMVREMLIPIYEQEVKSWKKAEKTLRDAGAYTYLALTK